MPLFITTGEKVKVDTRDGGYLGRVNSVPTASHRSADADARSQQGPQAGARHPVRGRSALPPTPLDDARRSGWPQADPPVPEYTVDPGRGRRGPRARIDELIDDATPRLDARPDARVDRNVLRIGVYELLWRDDDPRRRSSISEAVELARRPVDGRVADASSTACWRKLLETANADRSAASARSA